MKRSWVSATYITSQAPQQVWGAPKERGQRPYESYSAWLG
jgi:hypothetical protein